MPEAQVLYTVTIVVVVGLAAWVLAVLKTAKEPWARPGAAAAAEREPDVPVEKAETTDETEETEAGAEDGKEEKQPDAEEKTEA